MVFGFSGRYQSDLLQHLTANCFANAEKRYISIFNKIIRKKNHKSSLFWTPCITQLLFEDYFKSFKIFD